MEAGSKLAHFELIEPLGAGGMGEVYLAQDTRLGRKVAIKVLPAEFASDPERLARFEQEARAAAALNHPHIAVVHDIGTEGDTHFMVQEYLEGDTLREPLQKGALPLKKALGLATEIAEALAAAHAAGIIHRDLKPENIFVTKEGHAKVQDFGLAKLTEVAGAGSPGGATQSPTMMGTVAGQVMGTAGYMAPEQVEGSEEIDHRADLFAFGCVLYEMASGRRAFAGKNVIQTLDRIVNEEPGPLTDANPDLPLHLGWVVTKCLAKARSDRYQTAAEAAIDLKALSAAVEAGTAIRAASLTGSGQHPSETRLLVPLGVSIAATAIVFTAAGYWAGVGGSEAVDAAGQQGRVSTATEISLPLETPLPLGGRASEVGFDSPSIALSPDGSLLVFVGMSGATTQLYRREMNGFDVNAIPGTEGATHAFFSPDGESLGFLTNNQVKRVSLRGDPPQTLCNAQSPVTATWARDNAVYYTSGQGRSLWRVDAGGGECREVGSAVYGRRSYGKVLPEGKWALIGDSGVHTAGDYSDIQLLSLETLETRLLIRNGYDARYIGTGHILFGRSGGLYAVPFDLAGLTVTGEPVLVARDVRMDSFFSIIQVAASDNGVVAYVPGGDASVGKMAWIDRDGTTEYLPPEERLYGSLDLSPDGNRIAVHVADVNDYIGIYTIDRNEWKRLRAPENDGWPAWSPDGSQIAFISRQEADANRVVIQDVDNPDSAQVFSSSDRIAYYVSWNPTDRVMVLGLLAAARRGSGFLALSDDASSSSDLDPVFGGGLASFSGDGTHVAYNSDESGQTQIYVRSYPGNALTGPISDGYGIEARWCTRCNALFYRSKNQFFSTLVQLESAFAYEPPMSVFETDRFIDTPGLSYDITSDGQRLLVVKRAREMPRTTIHVIQNWLEATDGASSPN